MAANTPQTRRSRRPGWLAPRRVLVPNLSASRLAELKEVAPGIEFVVARTSAEAKQKAGDVHAIVGYPIADGWTVGSQVRWIHVPVAKPPVARRKGVTLTALPATDDPDQAWRLCRENVRRFASGERLLGVVK